MILIQTLKIMLTTLIQKIKNPVSNRVRFDQVDVLRKLDVFLEDSEWSDVDPYDDSDEEAQTVLSNRRLYDRSFPISE